MKKLRLLSLVVLVRGTNISPQNLGTSYQQVILFACHNLFRDAS